MKRLYTLCFISLLTLLFPACRENTTLKVLQFNIWHEGTAVENGFAGIVDNIINLNPDFVTFSEVRNYNGREFIPHLVAELEKKGITYYGVSSGDVGIISKYKITGQDHVYPLNADHGSVLKAIIPVKDETVILYSAHLDYTRYACYLPRGYSGTTWEKLETPVLNVDSIQTVNRESLRDEAIGMVINDALQEKEKGHIILIGGDFNEPSHLDWTEATKNLFDHKGVVIPWDCSVLLYENSFKDAFREIYPDPVTHPGFTFPSDNEKKDIHKLTWAPDADERDRIDYIYYLPDKRLKLQNAAVVGPSSSIVKAERVEENSEDTFILPKGTWPSDHKAVMVTFTLY